MKKQPKDIIWILIDTLMPDFLNLNNNQNDKKNQIEKTLLQGRLYTNVITAEKYTLGANYTIGTGLYGSVNGMNGIDYDFSREKPDVLFVGDYLKKLGYNTFRIAERRYRHFPSSGMDIFDLAPYKGLTATFGQTYDTPRRREMIECFNKTKSPKFLQLHMWTLHDTLMGRERKGRIDTSIGYKRALEYTSRDLSIILKLLKLSGDEVIAIFADHGAVLDRDFMKEETHEGTSLRPENLRTCCTFISPDLEPAIIDDRCSNIDILPTTFELAGLPPIPVQGKSLISSKGTESPICEGVEIYKYPFNRSCSSAYAIYKDKWKLEIRKGQKNKLYKINGKTEEEVKNIKREHKDIINNLTKKIYDDLSVSASDIRKRRIDELKSENKDFLMLKREELPVKIALFVTEANFEYMDRFIDDMKSQIEHYFDLHIFNIEEKDSEKLNNVDKRIKTYKDIFKAEKVIKILDAYNKNKPDFVGFVKPIYEYYEDYLYELRRLLEKNPEKDVAYAKLENINENMFLARTDFIKKLISKGIKIKELSSFEKQDRDTKKIEYKYPLGNRQKKKLTIFPLDNQTIELLKVEGINYFKNRSQLKKDKVDIIVCSNIKNIKESLDLSQLYNAIPVYIDYNSDSEIDMIAYSEPLKVIKRIDYRAWQVIKNKTVNESKKIWWLWEALEYCINKKNRDEKSEIKKILERKPIRYFTNSLIVRLTRLPIFNSYPVRKVLYSIDIKSFESLGCKNTSILKRKLPYNKHFNISNLPKK